MRWFAVFCLVASCSRGGYDAFADGALIFEGAGVEPFGGAAAAGLEVDQGAARLVREVGFEAGASQLAAPVAGAAATPIGNEILFSAGSRDALDGFPTGCSDELWRLDLASGQLVDAGRLPRVNQGHSLFVDSEGGLVLIMGCCNCGSNEEERAYRRPPGSVSFEQIGTFPVYAYGITAVPYVHAGADRVVVAGGRGSGPLRDAIQVLDVGSGTVFLWDETLPTPRCLATSVIVGTTMLVIGGHTHSSCTVVSGNGSELALDEIVAVDLVNETVSVIGHLPEPLGGACALVREDEVLLFGGFNYTGASGARAVSAKVYSIDPTDGSVTTYPEDMPAPRAGMACAANADGRVMLAGGIDAMGVATSSIWLFEPYATEGTLTSTVADAGVPGARWQQLDIQADQPPGTTVELELRVSDSRTALEDADWIEASGPVVPETVPRGRYLQWRATLRSTNAALTPMLHSVQLAFAAR